MAFPKLFLALDNLDKDEWTSLKKYMLMYTKEGSDNFSCLILLQKNKSSLLKDNYSEDIHKKYFPQMSSKVFSNLLSRIFKWYEDWFAIETFKNQEYYRDLMLVKGYNRKGLFSMANNTAKKLQSKIEEDNSIDITESEALAKLGHNQYYSSNPIKKEKNSSLFIDCLEDFIRYTKEESLRYLIELDNYSKARNVEYTKAKEILEKLVVLSNDSPLSQVLSTALKMKSENDLDSLHDLKNKLQENIVRPGSDLHLILSTYLRQSASIQSQKSATSGAEIILDCYQIYFDSIEKNANEKLLPVSLFNGVSAIANVMDFNKTEVFIERWAPKTHTKYPKSTMQYCTALNDFRHDRYERLPSLLSGLEFDDINQFKIVSKALMIIAHYKLGNEDIVMTMIPNFRKQLQRNSQIVAASTIKRINTLLDFIVKMQKSKYDSTIVVDRAHYNSAFFRSWIMKQF